MLSSGSSYWSAEIMGKFQDEANSESESLSALH